LPGQKPELLTLETGSSKIFDLTPFQNITYMNQEYYYAREKTDITYISILVCLVKLELSVCPRQREDRKQKGNYCSSFNHPNFSPFVIQHHKGEAF
jgi:hypothetical protein